jgi:hypothetical protein
MPEEKLKSEGKCLFCGKTFSKAGVNRHLKTHLENKSSDNKVGTSFLLKVETNPYWGTTPYFLSLWIDGETKMVELDDFLRGIWLECCGHMSAFRDPKRQRGGGMWNFFEAEELLQKGKTKEYEKLMEESAGEIPMSRKAKKVFCQDYKLEYEYDFGSTTELLITTLAQYPFKADKSIVLLSRNEPPKIMCSDCGKEPATKICTVCMYEDNALFCEKCAKKHEKECSDFEDYAAMPVVNSPRMGVCGYEGGTIDVERDGVYQE